MARQIPLNKLADTLGATLDQTVRAVKISLFNGIIDDTRVDEGRLKGGWQTTTGEMANTDIDRLDPDGNAAKAEVAATVRGDTIDYISNGLPYAEVWEERDGMIARNAARLERNIQEAIAKN